MGNPIMHFEIGCKNLATVKDFYVKLFDWQVSDFGGVWMVDTKAGSGINGHIQALGHEPHRYVTIYAQVDDIEKHLAKVAQLGGKTVIPKTEVPQAGWFAWFTDPDGNTVGLWTPVQQR